MQNFLSIKFNCSFAYIAKFVEKYCFLVGYLSFFILSLFCQNFLLKILGSIALHLEAIFCFQPRRNSVIFAIYSQY